MKRQKGFGLLEILITLVVLGVAVAGLVGFSKSALIASQDGRRYEIAMRLAESKLDEFRNFNDLVTGYNTIASGSTTKSQSNDSYTLAWTVSDQYWNGVSSTWQGTQPAGYLLNTSGRKQITTTVSWTDSAGVAKSVALTGDVSAVEALTTGQFNGGLNTARTGPQVNFTPGAAPDVISIALGNGNKQETSKPSPTVSTKKDTIEKEVQFETMTYKSVDQTLQTQQDITSVSCTCNYGSTLSAYLPGQAYSTSSDQLYWNIGTLQSKQTGVVSGNDQPGPCTSCCKDHFDGSGGSFTKYYAPLNTSRKRYNSSLTEVTSGSYLDACRLVRLDGYYRPLPDWNLVKVVVTTKDFLAKTANQVSYQNYIQYVVKAYIDWQKSTLNWTSNPTATAPTISEFATWIATNAASGGDTTTDITVNTGPYQLIARGIYIDILDPTYLAGIDTSDTKYLTKVPFQDINLTMLAEWSMSPFNGVLPGAVTDYADVSNEPVKTIVDVDNNYYGRYSRGSLTAKKSTKDASQVLKGVKVKATIYQGNSGVTATLISTRDQSLALSTELTVKIDTGVVAQPMLTVTGKIQCLVKTKNNDPTPKACDNNDYNKLSISPQMSSGVGCTISVPTSTGQIATYSCTAAQNSTLVISFSDSGSNPTFQFNPTSSLSIPMTPPANGDLTFTGPCTMMVDNGVTNASTLTCTP